MPRKKRKLKRPEVGADPLYNNVVLEKLINHIMYSGGKTIAQKIVYDAMTQVEKATGKQPMQIFSQAIKNISPMVEVKTRRVGGANYQVPVQVSAERRRFLALRWLIEAARLRKGHSMAEKLAAEMVDANKNEGGAIKKRDQVLRMAEANKAFAYMSW